MRKSRRYIHTLKCRFVGNIEEDGDYRICFDNRNSRWSDKTVSFEIQVEDPEDDYDDEYIDTDEWDHMKELNEDTMSMFEMKVDDIKTMLHTIRLKINRIRHFFFMHSGAMSKVTTMLMNLPRNTLFIRTQIKLIQCLSASTSGPLSS